MNKNLYLTETSKQYYISDFQKVLDIPNSDYWGIDQDIKGILIAINSNSKLQTLYSKRIKKSNNPRDPLSIESYLYLAFFQELKPTIEAFLNSLKKDFDEEREDFTEFNFELIEPNDNTLYHEGTSSKKIGCLNNPDYFQISYYKIQIKSIWFREHDLFWSKLSAELPQLI